MNLAYELHEARKARLDRFSQAAKNRLHAKQVQLPKPKAPKQAPAPDLPASPSCNRPYFPRRREIAAQVCEQHGLTFNDLKGPRRTVKISLARHILMYRLRHELGISTPQIGQFLNRDHTSVLHALKRISAAL